MSLRSTASFGSAQPSGGNPQRWRFLVVKDPEIKKKVQVYYKRLYDEIVGPRYASSAESAANLTPSIRVPNCS